MLSLDEDRWSVEEQLRVDGFLQLTRIEIGLRRLLERELKNALGDRWWKTLPADVKEKVVEARLDHLDFPDLKKSVAAKWRDLEVLHPIAKKEQLVVHLEELEPIRNSLAHSRDVTSREISLIRGTYNLLEPVLRPRPSEAVHSHADAHPAVVLIRIRDSLERNAVVAKADLKSLGETGLDPDAVENARKTIDAYNRVLRTPGYTRPERADHRMRAAAALEPLLASVPLAT